MALERVERRGVDGRAEAELYAQARAWVRRSRIAQRPLFAGVRTFTFRSGAAGGRLFRYSVRVPEDYDPADSYPAIIHLTGGNGFSEASFLAALDHLPEDYILAAPDPDYAMWWQADRAAAFDEFLDILVRDFAVNPDRLYLQGYSNGGVAAYMFGFRHPDRFAAVASYEGYSMSLADPQDLETELSLNMSNTPLLIVHGERDELISVNLDRSLTAFLARNDIPHKYIEVPQTGHRVSFETHHDAALAFFRKHKRNSAPREVRLVVDDLRYNRSFWVRVDEKLDPGQRAWVTARRSGSAFRLETRNVKRASLLLNDSLYETGRTIKLFFDKRAVFEGPLRLDPEALRDSLLAPAPDPASLYGVILAAGI